MGFNNIIYYQQCPQCDVVHETRKFDDYYCTLHHWMNDEHRRQADERRSKWMMDHSGWSELISWDD